MRILQQSLLAHGEHYLYLSATLAGLTIANKLLSRSRVSRQCKRFVDFLVILVINFRQTPFETSRTPSTGHFDLTIMGNTHTHTHDTVPDEEVERRLQKLGPKRGKEQVQMNSENCKAVLFYWVQGSNKQDFRRHKAFCSRNASFHISGAEVCMRSVGRLVEDPQEELTQARLHRPPCESTIL